MTTLEDMIRVEGRARDWAEVRTALHPGNPLHPDFDVDLAAPERPWIAVVEEYHETA